MAQRINKLSSISVKRHIKPGKYADGAGLYLQVSKSGSKSWIYRYMRFGKEREMGLGSHISISLADARKLASDCRTQLTLGQDPIDLKKEKQRSSYLAQIKQKTFRECALAFIEAHEESWKNHKHRKQWHNTLEKYVYPTIGSLPVEEVDTILVSSILEPIWRSKTETASRVRSRIENILDWANAKGLRKGENPARWRGHLENLLPAKCKVSQVKHLEAMPYKEIGAFLENLNLQDGVAPKALKFTILTCVRTNEALGAKWSEINFEEAIWTIPGERMKAGKTHTVPLTLPAMKILNEMKSLYESPYIFPGGSGEGKLSNMALLMILRRMNVEATVHGFRSTFSDWVADCTQYPHRLAEVALAHTKRDKVEAAYQRSDMFNKRRKLMESWAKFCADAWTENATLIQIKKLSGGAAF